MQGSGPPGVTSTTILVHLNPAPVALDPLSTVRPRLVGIQGSAQTVPGMFRSEH